MDTDLKVLVVDDSRIFRAVIEKILKDQKRIVVVGSVRNGALAIEFVKSHLVDLVTLDLEMPELDGLGTLKLIQDLNAGKDDAEKIGVIMLSSFTSKGAEITIKALESGAFDFITKPEFEDPEKNIEALQRQLVVKLRNFATNKININKANISRSNIALKKNTIPGNMPMGSIKPVIPKVTRPMNSLSNVKVILIGVSTGGPKALLQMIPKLSEKINLPILIVQHMPPTFTLSLANNLNTKCNHTVVEGSHNDAVQENYIYIAPGGLHMEVKRDVHMRPVTVLTEDPPENGCRPSVDVLFRSAVGVFGGNIIAIVLTGMGSDGTKGLEPLKKAGAYVVAQDEATSVVWGMPGSVANAGLADAILPLDAIPDAVFNAMQNKF